MLVTGKLSEETFDQLRLEWQEKIRNAELSLAEMERESKIYLDELDLALILLTKITVPYPRLSLRDKATLLQIITKRIIVDTQGKIIDHELNSPFVYLKSLADENETQSKEGAGSARVQRRLLKRQRGTDRCLFSL
jgi:hypothetical protein